MNYTWIALVLSILATLPQLYQTVTTGSVRDHNQWSPIIAIGANFFIALHGYTHRDYGLVFLGGWFIMYNSVITYFKSLTTSS